MGLSKKTALRAGYGSVIALLLFSSIDAYQIQKAVSERHIETYRNYVQKDASATELRRTIWFAGNYVRDFFIDTSVENGRLLKSQLKELKQESQRTLDALDKLSAIRRTHPGLVSELQEFWNTMEPIPDSMLHKTDAEQYEFVQREIVPRRSSLHNLLRELMETDLSALQQSEADFASTRSAAARRLILMLGLCIVLALAVSRFSLRYSESLERESDRQYEEAVRARREQEQLSTRLLEIEEEDKKKLSRELHDEIGQTLGVLQIEITHALAMAGTPGSGLDARLRRARDLAERTVQTVRNIALLLRPALLDDLGLAPALQWKLEDFMRRSGVFCEFSEEGVEDALPDPVKTCVYRVVQEALHNCEKHAGAKRIAVKLRQAAGTLTATVEDDGRGFEFHDAAAPNRGTGLGLLGMRERAARIGGVLLVDTAPGRGTRLSLTIPLAAGAGIPTADAVPSEAGA